MILFAGMFVGCTGDDSSDSESVPTGSTSDTDQSFKGLEEGDYQVGDEAYGMNDDTTDLTCGSKLSSTVVSHFSGLAVSDSSLTGFSMSNYGWEDAIGCVLSDADFSCDDIVYTIVAEQYTYTMGVTGEVLSETEALLDVVRTVDCEGEDCGSVDYPCTDGFWLEIHRY